MNTRHRLFALIPAAVLAASCGHKTAPPPPSVPEVGVVTIAPRSVSLGTELPGRTTAYRIAEVRPQVSGILQKRLFTEGAEVRAGQALYQIDPATYQAAEAGARAQLAASRGNPDHGAAARRAL